jgi:membrane-associated phospholipid phosphatase
MKWLIFLLCFLIAGLNLSLAAENPTPVPATGTATIDYGQTKFDLKTDFLQSLRWAWEGSYMQFQGTQNLVFASFAVVATGYFIQNDDEISAKVSSSSSNSKILRLISDSSIFFNTPILAAFFYSYGRSQHDPKMIRFSQEYFSALALALVETAAISMIPVHQRPDQKDLSFWEKAFRGQSSFPSGHVIGYSVLGFKSFQFYGPYYAILPLTLAAATAYERVNGEKHYASDVIASGFISLLASEGVRYASHYRNNHPIYEWIFNHDFDVGYRRIDGVPGIAVSFNF